MRRLTALLFALAGLAAMPASAAACEAAAPAFADILATDSTIVVGRAVASTWPDSYPEPAHVTVEVERVLRGRADATVVVKDWPHFCGGTLPMDERMIVVVSMQFGDPETPPNHPLAPYIWWLNGKPAGTATHLPAAATIDELADRIAAALPDTATGTAAATIEPSRTPWLALAAGLAALAFFLSRPLRRRRTPG